MFFATNICRYKSSVATKYILSRQFFRNKTFVTTYFCRDKRRLLSRQTCVCRNETFVATKMILVAAPTNDRQHQFQRTEAGAAGLVCVGMDIIFPWMHTELKLT